MSRGKALIVVLVIVLVVVCGVVSILVLRIGFKGKESKPTLPPPTGIIYRANNVEVTLLAELPLNTKITSIWSDFRGSKVYVGDDHGRVWMIEKEEKR